jgi:hypothetical protein
MALGPGFDPRVQIGGIEKGQNLTDTAPVPVPVMVRLRWVRFVVMRFRVRVMMLMVAFVRVPVRDGFGIRSIREAHIEFGAVNGGTPDAAQGKRIAAEAKLFQVGLEAVKGSAGIQQGADDHVAAGTGKRIEVKVTGVNRGHAGVSHLRGWNSTLHHGALTAMMQVCSVTQRADF